MNKNKSIKFIFFLILLYLSDLTAASYMGGRTPPPDCYNSSSSGSGVASRRYNRASDVSCRSAPPASCSYGVCSPARCISADGWCAERFTPVPTTEGFNLNPPVLSSYPGVSNVKMVNLDQIGVDPSGKALKVIHKYSDPDISSCSKPDGSGNYDVQGGETICDVGIMYGVYHANLEDSVLTFINTFERPVFAKCSYFNPTCGSCCTGWTPPVCCPPPPPPPPP